MVGLRSGLPDENGECIRRRKSGGFLTKACPSPCIKKSKKVLPFKVSLHVRSLKSRAFLISIYNTGLCGRPYMRPNPQPAVCSYGQYIIPVLSRQSFHTGRSYSPEFCAAGFTRYGSSFSRISSWMTFSSRLPSIIRTFSTSFSFSNASK